MAKFRQGVLKDISWAAVIAAILALMCVAFVVISVLTAVTGWATVAIASGLSSITFAILAHRE